MFKEKEVHLIIHVLVVEDDKDLNETVCRHLNMHRYQTTGCLNPTQAYDRLFAEHYDLIISDIMMPEIDGFEFAKTIRQQDKNIPFLFLTARNDFTAKEAGYRLGIDDYLVKPVDLNELILHIEALLRRANIAAEKKLTIGNLVLDEDEISATVDDIPVQLTFREFQILFKLLSYPKHAFTRSQLLDDFTDMENESGLRIVDVYIANLRTKFAHCKEFQIVTVRGLGYNAVIQ